MALVLWPSQADAARGLERRAGKQPAGSGNTPTAQGLSAGAPAAQAVASGVGGDAGVSVGMSAQPSKGSVEGAPPSSSPSLSGTVLQFLSYEGELTAVEGPAAGMQSRDVGMKEGKDAPVDGSLGLVGEGRRYADFRWALLPQGRATPGKVNNGQAMTRW